METKHACELFDKKDASPDELYAAMSDCTKVHNQLTKEAAMGKIYAALHFKTCSFITFLRPIDTPVVLFTIILDCTLYYLRQLTWGSKVHGNLYLVDNQISMHPFRSTPR